MKKLIVLIAALTVFSCAAFAEDDGFASHLRVEAGVPMNLLPFGLGLDVSAAYEFDINDSFMWDAGVDLSLDPLIGITSSILIGRSLNTNVFASFWWKALYVRYGLGMGFNFDGGNAAFIPIDLRIGWEPQFWSGKKSGLSFKLEGGIFGMAQKAIEHDDGTKDGGGFVACFTVNAGVAYRF